MTPTTRYHLGKFPLPNLDWVRLIPLIGPANAALARYEGILQAVPDPNVLLAPLMTQEAVLSSRIEGTQASMGEVLRLEAGDEPDGLSATKRGDIREVLNYRQALTQCVQGLEELPLSQRLLRQAHQTLLQGARGEDKDRGEYRRVQNWIGRPGCTIDQARFVPIEPQLIPDAMSAWEKYIHADELDLLVQLAVVHAEFEALHPFLDGNGRLGRLLIPLFLFEKKLLSWPTFYMSSYLEQNRDVYYDRLLAVSRDDDWTGWCEFFLEALRVQAEDHANKANQILKLYERTKERVISLTHSQHAMRAVDFLFRVPLFNAKRFTEDAGIPKPTASRILRLLRENDLLWTIREGQGRRPGLYSFEELLRIAEGRISS